MYVIKEDVYILADVHIESNANPSPVSLVHGIMVHRKENTNSSGISSPRVAINTCK